METTSDDESSGSHGTEPEALPAGATDWLQFLSVLVGGALTALTAIAAVFFLFFGVTLEELGYGVRSGGALVVLSITVVSTLLYLVIFFPSAKAMSNGWLSVRNQIKELRQRGPGRVLTFYAFWVVLPTSVAGFFALVLATSQDQFQLGPYAVPATVVVVFGAMGFWYGLYRAHQRWLLIDRPPLDQQEATNLARKLRFAAVGVTVVFQVVLLLVLTIGNVARVRDGRATQGWLYQVSPATVVPLAAVPSELEETLSHCLLYFGQANGVTVLYDSDAEAIVRLPTSGMYVEAPLGNTSRPGSPCA